jgi:hypothetical protein
MTFRVSASLMAVVAGTLGLASAADGFVFWSSPNGAGSFFTYSGGGSDNGLFGDPVLLGGNTFTFFPAAFAANSSNGIAQSTNDRLEVTLQANPGQQFTQIKITEWGDWAITGIGTVRDSGTLFITDLVNSRSPAVQGMSYPSNPMPISTPGQGVWTGSSTINLTSIAGPAWTNVTLVFTNTLQATTQAGSTAHIQKTLTDGAVVVQVLPTPGALALLGAGGLLLARRRRA